MRKQWTRTILGLLLVAAGLGFAGDVLDLWHFDLFFRGWWTLFIRECQKSCVFGSPCFPR